MCHPYAVVILYHVINLKIISEVNDEFYFVLTIMGMVESYGIDPASFNVKLYSLIISHNN